MWTKILQKACKADVIVRLPLLTYQFHKADKHSARKQDLKQFDWSKFKWNLIPKQSKDRKNIP